jgi:hypothetical protein
LAYLRAPACCFAPSFVGLLPWFLGSFALFVPKPLDFCLRKCDNESRQKGNALNQRRNQMLRATISFQIEDENNDEADAELFQAIQKLITEAGYEPSVEIYEEN